MFKVYQEMSEIMTSAETVEDLNGLFQKCMSAFDLDQYAYQIVQHNYLQHMKNYVVTTYADEWQRNYFKQDYFDTDPLVNKFLNQSTPFIWKDGTFENEEGKAKKMLTEARDFNLHHGIGIPIPGPNNSFSILTLCSGSLKTKELAEIYENFYKDIMICALMYHSSFISLNLDNLIHNRYDLTNKELETLKWICSGKSDSVISSITGVSVHTINARAKNIYKKLEVMGRTEAILKANKYKLVEL